MTAEMLEIARAFAACPKFVWLAGMLDSLGRRVLEVDNSGMSSKWTSRDLGRDIVVLAFCTPAWAFEQWRDATPDLDDPLTRLGLLEVVRRAWGDHRIHLVMHETHARDPDGGRDLVLAMWWALADDSGKAITDGRRFYAGPTEEAALLAALQAAP